jgi:acylpyruvate hydrolase
MRLASFVDPRASIEARFGIVRGENIVDVVAAANRLHRPVPATTVKLALTSGAQTITALKTLRARRSAPA